MKIHQFVHIFLISVIAVAISACVPKATEPKATCGTNEAFNNVTRKCYSVVETRYKPVATKSTDTLTEDTAKTITLTYTDVNNNQASSCAITANSSNIEPVSPQLVNGAIYTKADLALSSANLLAINMPAGPDQVAATAEYNSMLAAITNARGSFNHSNILSQHLSFRTSAEALMTLASSYTATVGIVRYYYNLLQTRLADYDIQKTSVDNRCYCTGGVCTTSVAPKIHEFGSAGLTYTVTDGDGTSDPRAVSLTINALSASTTFLKPAVESVYASVAEGATNEPVPVTFFLGGAGDYRSSSFSYSHGKTVFGSGSNSYIETDTGKGKISNCLGLGGSVSTDISCVYTPYDGDEYSLTVPAKATVTLGDLTISAKAEGTFGNDIKIYYKNISADLTTIDSYSTKAQKFGLVGNLDDIYIRVLGNDIYIVFYSGVTTTAELSNAINNDPVASRLIAASAGSAAAANAASAAAGVSLGTDVAGTGGYDVFTYRVTNGSVTSTAVANIHVSSTVDRPVWLAYPTLASPLLAINDTSTLRLEGTPAALNMSIAESVTFSDPDDVVTTCEISTDSTNLIFWNSSTYGLSGVTAAEVDKANTDFNDVALFPPTCSISGTAPNKAITFSVDRSLSDIRTNTFGTYAFLFKLTDGAVNQTADPIYQAYRFSVTPVNDEPTIAGISWENTEGETGVVPVMNVDENSDLVPTSAYVDITIDPDNATTNFESDQTMTVTAKSSDQSLLKDENILITVTGATTRRISFATEENVSGNFDLLITVQDNGGTTNSGDDTLLDYAVDVTVDYVNHAPYLINSISSAETNEGGVVVAGPFKVDEDYGSTTDEDPQQVMISAISSDNQSLLPDSNISVFYDVNENGVEDSGESRATGVAFDTVAADDVKALNFFIKLRPNPGIAGNANISFTLQDTGAGNPTTTTFFSLITHPIAALHGGWTNISAVGIKTDKNGAPASSADIKCNYNKACNTGADCTGTASPAASVTPDVAGILFWDSSNKRCYLSNGTTKFTWVDFNTICPVTKVSETQNLISSGPSDATAANQYYYDTSNSKCYVSSNAGTGAAANWVEYIPAKVTLAWNDFTVTGSGSGSGVGVYGWNIYRREVDKDYDFAWGFLKANPSDTMTISNPATRIFTDTTAVAGKVYFYVVRPVDSISRSRTISTPEIFSEVRVLAPKENFAFVHRWMVNQEICNSMHMTTSTTNRVDPTKNYRCPFKGPGESQTYDGYYDIEKDMLVDISEMGCPYTPAPTCSGSACVGIGAPSYAVADGTIYYDRNDGVCYIRTAGAWQNAQQAPAAFAASTVRYNSALNAPLVNLSQSSAQTICAGRNVDTGSAGTIAADLPTKKEFIAYSAGPFGMTDPLITDLEQGFSLNSQSRCNSSSANGLESAYTDSSIPSTSFMYSLPGTASSGIKSLYTGSVPWGSSYGTQSCSSRYGVQDVYGNVAEWVKDSVKCEGASPAILSTTITDAYLSLSIPATAYGHTSGETVRQFTTGSSTLLNGAVVAGTTSIQVDSTTGFNSAGGYLAIGDELVMYSAVPNSTTLTVSALARAHGDNEPVVGLDTIVASSSLRDTIAVGATSINVSSNSFTPGTGYIAIGDEYISDNRLVVNALNYAHTSGEAVELYSVGTTTALNGAVSATAVTLTVDSTAGFPASGVLQVGDELVAYSAVPDGTTITVSPLVRSHADNAVVRNLSLVASTTLSASTIIGDSLITVANADAFPDEGVIAIDDEVGTLLAKYAFSSKSYPSTLTVDSVEGFSNTGTIVIGTSTLTYNGVVSGTPSTINNVTPAEFFAVGSTVTFVPEADNFICYANSTTDLGKYNIETGVYDVTHDYTTGDRVYAFDLFTGPYNDQDADSAASYGDAFLTEWDLRDELFGAGKFNFPLGMPITVDISSKLPLSPALNYFLDIGPTAGITSTQLHEDGFIVNGAAVRNNLSATSSANPDGYDQNSTQTGFFAQGGSYLSGNRAGRYSSEVIPEVMVGPDVGFRCYVPIPSTAYPVEASGQHAYDYEP